MRAPPRLLPRLAAAWLALIVGPTPAQLAHGAVTDAPPTFRPPPGDPLARPELEALRRRYLEAHRAFRAGETARAARQLQELVGAYPAMAGPIRKDLAAIAAARGEHAVALAWADALLAGEGIPPSLLPQERGFDPGALPPFGATAAWGFLYRGEALLGLERPEPAAAAFEAALSARGRGTPPRARLHHQLARALERLGDRGGAYRHYLLTARAAQSTSWGISAAEAIARLEPRMGYEELEVRDLLGAEIVSDLIKAGREQEALARIDEVMATCVVPEVRQQLQVNRSLCEARLASPDEGVRLLHRLTYTPHLSGAQYWAVVADLQRLLARQRDPAGRVNVLRRFLATFPATEEAIEARTILAGILMDQGRASEAEELYREIVRLHPEHPASDDARWALSWRSIVQGDLAAAFPILQDHALTVLPGTQAEARAVYWLGRAARGQGRELLAQWMFVDVARRFPDTYYGVMARWRTGQGVPGAVLADPQDVMPARFPVVTETLTADGGQIQAGADSWSVGRALLFPGFIQILGGVKDPSVAQTLARAMETALMGRMGDSSVALADARADRRSDHRALLIVSAFYHSLGQLQSGMRVGHSHLAAAPIPTYHGPRELRWALAYPWPFLEHFVREGWRYAIQPALMAAMAQQESGFWPTARSSAGARGLMQLMPATARTVARALGMAPPSPAELLDPAVSARLGASYLRDMLDRFGGDVTRALAAYNAGPGAVQRWGRRLGDVEDDVFVEEIPYTETRDYVRVVLRNYAGYRDVYPGMLMRPSTFPPARPQAARPRRGSQVAEEPGDLGGGRESAAPGEPTPNPEEPGGVLGPGGTLDF